MVHKNGGKRPVAIHPSNSPPTGATSKSNRKLERENLTEMKPSTIAQILHHKAQSPIRANSKLTYNANHSPTNKPMLPELVRQSPSPVPNHAESSIIIPDLN